MFCPFKTRYDECGGLIGGCIEEDCQWWGLCENLSKAKVDELGEHIVELIEKLTAGFAMGAATASEEKKVTKQ